MHRVLRAAAVVGVCALLTTVPYGSASAEEQPSEASTLTEKVAEAAESGASGADQLAAAVGLPASGPTSLAVDATGDIAVTVSYGARPSDADVEAVAAIARVDRVYGFSPAIAVTVAPERLPQLQALPGVQSVVPVVAAASGLGEAALSAAGAVAPATVAAAAPDDESCRAVPVEADAPQRTDEARETFGVDGTGVTVGIISDSYNLSHDVTTPEQDVAMGVLPGPGNPCGYETPVEVLFDSPTTGDDEGRAMAQLVHGIAPGAKLIFASGWGGPNGMADAIVSLADAGADIIVDDLGYGTETYYQQGLISVAIDSVRDRGVAYYSSAGNANVAGAQGTPSAGRPISSWQTDAWRGTECPAWVEVPETVTEFDCLDFDPSSEADAAETIGLNGYYSPQFLLSWAEPIFGVTSSFSLELYTDADEPELVDSSVTLDARIPNEILAFEDAPEEGTYQLVAVRDLTNRTATEPAVWLGTFTGADALTWREYDTSVGADIVGPVTFGHPADGSAIGVAAAPWSAADEPEPFSSPGPGVQLFAPLDPNSTTPSPAYDEPASIAAPVITGVDGTRTSFFGGPGDGTYRFYGTSAAAPNVAAVHALAAQYTPSASADELTAVLTETTTSMTNPFAGILPDEDVYGAGLVNGYAALAALPTPSVSGLAATPLSPTSIAVEWDELAGAFGYQVELLADGSIVEQASLDADATATTFADLTPDTAYRVRIAAKNTAGELGAWTESSDVRTLIPPHPETRPAAPGEAALTPATQGGLVATPSTVRAGEKVTITGVPARAWVYAWAYSTPTELGWAWTGAAAAATVTIPEGFAAGAHRIAVTDADGDVIGWVDVTVTADVPVPAPAGGKNAALAHTGVEGDAFAAAAWGAGILAAAGLLLLGAHRVRRTRRDALTQR